MPIRDVTYNLIILDDNATNIVLPNTLLCPEDDLRVECTARNTSIIQWSSSAFKSDNFALCQRDDPSIRNYTTSDGIGIVVEAHYSASTFVLACNLEIKASQLPMDQQLLFTCHNVDIGISKNGTSEVSGKLGKNSTKIRMCVT